MSGEPMGHPGRPHSPVESSPFSEEALALLPYSFLELDRDGIVLRAEGRVPGCSTPDHERVVGHRFFSDLLRAPASLRVRDQYRAMARKATDNRFLTALGVKLEGEEKRVELVFSYYASAGLCFVLMRLRPPENNGAWTRSVPPP